MSRNATVVAIDVAVDDDDNNDAGDDDDYDDVRTCHYHKQCLSATYKAPQIGVSEQTDVALRSDADGAKAARPRSAIPFDVREAPGRWC